MEKRFILPASTLFAGIIIWVIFLIFYSNENPVQIMEILIGFITGGVMFFSGFSCRRAGGPRAGNIFRASLLLVMAVITYWLIGILSAILLLAAAVAIQLLLVKKPEPAEEGES